MSWSSDLGNDLSQGLSKDSNGSLQDAPSRIQEAYQELVDVLESTLHPEQMIKDLIQIVASYLIWTPKGLKEGSLVDIYDLIAGSWYLASVLSRDDETGSLLIHYNGWTARWRETITEDSFDRLAPPNSMSAEKWHDSSEVAFLSNSPDGWKSETAQIVAVSHHTRGFHQIRDELSPSMLLQTTQTLEMSRCPHHQRGGKTHRNAEGACVLLRLLPSGKLRWVSSSEDGRLTRWKKWQRRNVTANE